MTCFNIETLTADSDHALALWNCAAEHDPMGKALWREKVWEDDGAQQEGRLLVFHGDSPIGLVVAATRLNSAERRGYVKMLAVHPEFRRQGTGSLLLALAEGHLAEQGCREVRAAESAPNYLTPGVDERYQEAAQFFPSRGYARLGEAVNMTVALQGNSLLETPRQSLPGGCRIERAASGDQAAVLTLLREHWPAWEHEVLAALANAPPTLLLAWEDVRVVGFSAYECNNRGTGWFGPMGVAPQARGRGLGRRLLLLCLEEMSLLGFQQAIIPWVGPTEFYAQTVGAVIDRRFTRYQKFLPQ
ncbi:MAG: GNAT family N-acetyltransferase [Planctomycetales bacterium]|nr:GNAT family N-acetyltransferase [Planctomycetales bacterium]